MADSVDVPIPLFQLLGTLDPELRPTDCKVHLAVHNGKEDPLDVYVAGRFDAWQAWQNGPNFNRNHVVALVALPERDKWLLAGVYRVGGVERVNDKHFEYDMLAIPMLEPLRGRAVIQFTRTGRQSYLVAENWLQQMTLAEIRPERLQIADFPGFHKTLLTKQQLDLIVGQRVASWKAALGSVAGVYVITDRNTGKLYVGSASGGEGIWSRWCSYSETGHGGNHELVQLLRDHGPEYAQHFQFGILEIADTHADVLARESHWKHLLGTRAHGYNSN